MLERLLIRNVALIDRLEIELDKGFNVLTGETGAGKSIIIDAVNLALGERASKELITYGADKAVVEAAFDISGFSHKELLDELGIEYDDELIVSRELSASGKNICRINGTLSTLSALKSITDTLVDVHGQHEHQSLLSPSVHLAFLDMFAHASVTQKKAETSEFCRQYSSLRSEMLSGFGSDSEREREADILRYQINEIDASKLYVSEEDELLSELKLLTNAEKIREALELCNAALSSDESGAVTLIDTARRSMGSISDFSADYSELSSKLDDAYYQLEDIGFTVRGMKEDFEFDAERLDAIEHRLDIISDLKRKYGKTVGEVLRFRDDAVKRLAWIESVEKRAGELETMLNLASDRYITAAGELSALRKTAAAELGHRLVAELGELGLEKARFECVFKPHENTIYSPNGFDDVEFMLSTNSGEPLKPLVKVASGGEMSRIMLAFKTIFAENDSIPTLIFDEIDTGISGRVAAIVGDKMVRIADTHQVICITHLPQIASLADTHFLVEKSDDGEKTRTSVRELDYSERCTALALMMSGDVNGESALNHARELIERAEDEKHKRRKSN